MLVTAGDTRLNVEERGAGDLALIVLHGGPGLDHTMFGDWLDPLGAEHRLLLVDERSQGRSDPAAGAVYAPDVLRAGATEGYGHIELEDRLGDVTHPLLVIAGRHDRTCSVRGAEAIATGVPAADLVVLEDSGHMTYVEEPGAYREAVRHFLGRL